MPCVLGHYSIHMNDIISLIYHVLTVTYRYLPASSGGVPAQRGSVIGETSMAMPSTSPIRRQQNASRVTAVSRCRTGNGLLSRNACKAAAARRRTGGS